MMSALRKFLPGKKKNKKSTSSSIKSAVSEQNIAGAEQVPGNKDVKEKDLPKLHKAAWHGDMAKLKQLLKKTDVNSMDRHHRTPLHYACMKGNNEVTQWLCANRANLGICDEDGKGALMKAVEAASESCVETLLNHGAEANIVDVNLTTPLHIAATHGSIRLATLLLEHGAKVNASDNEKITPLYLAASFNFTDLLEFLLKEYALVNEADIYGRTPLIAAAMEGHDNVVKILLDYGADMEIKDKEGWKAIDHAEMRGNHSISDILKQHDHEEETVPAEQPTANINFGSGVGSPFRSTSTQPSTYGGPALNITADSEDDSIGNESPQRPDFQNSWADSDSDLDDDNVKTKMKGLNIASTLKHTESTQSKTSLSKIPIATSQEAVAMKDDTELSVERSPSKSESKIPRFGGGSKGNIKSSSKEDISSPSHTQPASRIPRAAVGKGSPSHETLKDELKSKHGGSESKIPRLSGSSMSRGTAERPSVELKGSAQGISGEEEAEDNRKKQPFEWDSAMASSFDSDNGDVSETDILAALTGTPIKKVEKQREKPFTDENKAKSFAAPSSMDARDINPGTKAAALDGVKDEQNKDQEEYLGDDDEDGSKLKNSESDWDSTEEEASAPKPNLRELLKNEKETGDFDLDVNFDSSIEETEASSPEVKGKFSKGEDQDGVGEEEGQKSLHSDFSLSEGEVNAKAKISEGAKKEGDNLEGNKDEGPKTTKGFRAQLEALGIEAGSSLDSSSEDDSIGKSSASFAHHDDIFTSKDTILIEMGAAKSKKPDFESEEKQHSAEKEDPIDATQTSGKSPRSEEGKLVTKDNGKVKAKSAKAQYAALGIDLSDESSMETESEWEASMKAKKIAGSARNDDARNIGLDKDKINDKSQEDSEYSKDNIRRSGSEREKQEKNDSEFISDESFSVNTEGQLEELEEMRLKKADEDENPPSGFDDSDFSFSESSKKPELIEGNSPKLNSEDESDSEVGVEEEAISRSEVPMEDSEDEEAAEDMVIREDYMPRKDKCIRQEDFDSEFDEDQREFVGNQQTGLSGSLQNIEVTDDEGDRNGVKSKENEGTDETEINEKAEFFRNIVNSRNNAREITNDVWSLDEVAKDTNNLQQKKQTSDAERKKSLEAMLSPVESVAMQYMEPESVVTPVFVEKVESGIGRKEISDAHREQPNANVENAALVEHESFDELNEIEEEFERRLKEKEMESRKSPNGDAEGIRGVGLEDGLSHMNEKLEETEDEQSLGSLQQHEEQEKAAEVDLGGQRSRNDLELKLKKHQDELRQKERDFEMELRRKDAEERERRQRIMEEREKERKKLEDMQKKQREDAERAIAEAERKRKELEEKQRQERKEKEERERSEREKVRKQLEEVERKKAEEEVKKLEKEKEMWEKKKGKFKDLRGRMELEEAAKRRKMEEIAAAESSRRLKEQEDLLKKMKEDKTSQRVDTDDGVADSKRNQLEELAVIEQFLREQEEDEKRRISKSVSNEDVIQDVQSNSTYAARNILQEDYISPVNRANQLIENEIWLEPLETRLPEQAPAKRAGLNKPEDSGKMKQESELLLQAAVSRTNELLRGEKTENKGAIQGNVGISPRQKQVLSDDLSDYGSADIDDIIKVSSFAHQRDDIDPIIHTPGSDAVDTGMVNYQSAADYPIASTPFGRYDSHGVVYAHTISPIARPKSAPYTMSENEISTAKPATPMALYTSLSQTGHFQDSKALMKMQDALKESKREGERMKEKNIILETMKKEMETDLREMQRTVEVLSRSQTDFEKLRLDMEMEMREVKFRLDNEIQSRIAAEGLVSQLKEQIKRGDEKLSGEVEARQAVELAYKTLESEFRKRDTLISQFENEVNDLRFALYHEREARVNQEKLYKDQLKQHELLLEETQKTSLQHAQTLNQLEVTDQNRQSAESNVNQLKIDLAKTNSELTRVNAQLEDVKSTYENEVARLRNKLQDTMDELVKSERELFQAQMHMEAEKSTAKAEQLRLSASLESENANKRRLETELNVLKTQMQNANNELERVAKTKSLTESEANKFKEESYKDRNKHDRELAHAKDELQRIFMKLDASERRCDSLESELQAANIALTEKSGHVVMSQREMDYKTSLLNQMEEKFRHEKEINQKLASKIDNGSERSSVLQREIDNLKRELETANQRTVDCDKAARDAQSKFEALLGKAKEDFDKERYNLEQRILQLSESALRYKEEHAEDKEEVKSKDNEIKSIQKELTDLAKTLSAAEAAKEIQTKNGERLEQDNSKLSKQNAVLEKELNEMTSLKNELAGKVEDMSEQLEHMLKVSDHTNSKLVQRDNDVQNAKLSRAELEKSMTRLKVEKAELVSELREEQAKSEMILDDLRKSNDARESLEKILSNLKTTNVHLEEKLQSETITRAQHERDAEEHKDLWNSEVKSRSRLGLKLVTMEKEIQRLNDKLEDEKRKTVQVEELKRTLESKLDDYDKRTLQHQRESSAMKTKLKQYQKRIKDFENGERRIPKIYSEFEREKDVMLNNSANLRRQVDSLIEQLRQEQEYRSKAETNSKRNEQELVDLRAKEKILSFENSKLGRENEMLEEELEKLKNFYERNYVDKTSLDSFKRDIETKARLEINRKLQDVNMQLEEQAAAREAYDRLRSETESKCKKELESTINDLKKELSFVKSALQEGIIKNSTYETEAKRARELYQQEIAEKQKLSEVVEKLNSRSVRLGLESPRKNYTKELRDMPFKKGGSMYLSAERDEHPSRPASRSSEMPNRTAISSFTTPALRGSTTRDYLPAYRQNYLT